jgi:hypothetical protein
MKYEIPQQEHTQILAFVTGHVWITQRINGEETFIVIPVQNVDLFCKMVQEAKRDAEEKRDRAVEIRADLARKGFKV